VRLVPPSADNWLAALGVGLVRFLAPGLHGRMLDHLRLVYGGELNPEQRAALAERVWHKQARNMIEFFRLARANPEELRRGVVIRGLRQIRALRARHVGVIGVTAHYGNFELLGALWSVLLGPWAVIVREKDDAGTENYVNAVRRRFGQVVVHKEDFRTAARLLRQGHAVGLAADQAAHVGGVMADFLGHPGATALGAPTLARLGQAALVCSFITRDANGRLTAEIHRPLALPDDPDQEAWLSHGAQAINDVLSAQIRCQPDEWLWLHRRWKQPLSLRSARR
jgi:KDO2-lipid IV(A) lauroyltransferase